MDFVRRSITAKSFLMLLFGFAFFAAVDYLAIPLAANYGYAADVFSVAVLFIFFIFAFAIILLWVHKPLAIVFQEMKALLTNRPYKKIFTRRIDEVGVLAHFFNDMTKNLARISVDIEEGRRMSKELSVGSDIQRKILPISMPQVMGLQIHGNTRPASEVGGDNFDVIPTSENTYIYAGDVTGHGLPAGLIMVMVNTLIRTFSEIYTSGYDVIANTNRILKQRIEARRFMTCVLLRWSHQEQKMYYTGAGHEHILIFHKKTGECEVKQTGGIALGMVPDITKIIREEQIPLEEGDFIVLYTDGIIEAKNMQGEMFGLNRLKRAVEQYAISSTPSDLFVNISKDFGYFVGDQIQVDDITLIAIQRTP